MQVTHCRAHVKDLYFLTQIKAWLHRNNQINIEVETPYKLLYWYLITFKYNSLNGQQ